MSTEANCAVIAVGVLGAGVTTIIIGQYVSRLDNRAALTLPRLAVIAGGFVTLALMPALPAHLVGISLIGVGVGVTNPPLLAYLADLIFSDDGGKLGGVYNVFRDVGASLGPVIALPLVTSVGFRSGYLLCVGLIALMSVVVAATLLGDGARLPPVVPGGD
jgi:MFS family permease